jgi:hypothetical protein
MALFICLHDFQRARVARVKNKNMIRPLARIFLRGLLVPVQEAIAGTIALLKKEKAKPTFEPGFSILLKSTVDNF